MVQTTLVEGVHQGLQHVLLTDHVFEAARPPLAGEYLVAHGRYRLGVVDGLLVASAASRRPARLPRWPASNGGGRASHTPAHASAVTAAPFRA
ncbi:MAG: hypothetical protein HONDAALG_04056 [Gammaproteobacteria bacterium]|nr:hypothetical protein [Gammaproteobacteria bacterium]